MAPVTPVLPSAINAKEVIFAKDQPQYIPLPAIISSDGVVTTRWKLSFKEYFKLIFTRSIYLQQLTFGNNLQPVKILSEEPKYWENSNG